MVVVEATRRREFEPVWTVTPNLMMVHDHQTRRVEFEIRAPDSASGPVDFPVHALYYVCEGVASACLYRLGRAGRRMSLCWLAARGAFELTRRHNQEGDRPQ